MKYKNLYKEIYIARATFFDKLVGLNDIFKEDMKCVNELYKLQNNFIKLKFIRNDRDEI